MCDGFEVELGEVSLREAYNSRSALIKLLHAELDGLTILCVHFKRPKYITKMWVTLGYGSRPISRQLMGELLDLQKVLRMHAGLLWNGPDFDPRLIQL